MNSVSKYVEPRTTVTIRLSESRKDLIFCKAKKRGLTASTYINLILDDYFEKETEEWWKMTIFDDYLSVEEIRVIQKMKNANNMEKDEIMGGVLNG